MSNNKKILIKLEAKRLPKHETKIKSIPNPKISSPIPKQKNKNWKPPRKRNH
jgi:hypothetical protein